MPQSHKIPPTPKMGSISLPDELSPEVLPRDKKRISFSFLKGSSKTDTAPRSMTPAPLPTSIHDPPRQSHSRRRASSMTSGSIPPVSSSRAKRQTFQYGPPATEQPRPTLISAYSAPNSAAPWSDDEHRSYPPKPPKPVLKRSMAQAPVTLSWPLVAFSQREHLPYPKVYFDIAFDPQDPNNLKDNRHRHFADLSQQDREMPICVNYRITEIVVVCPLVGSLVVRRPEGLRCIDVFFAIYSKYQKKAAAAQLPSEPDWDRCQQAFKLRCKEAPGLTEYNRKLGLLRVDLLCGRRIFDGLWMRNGQWELQIFKVPIV
ncbi:unnamed protein product [Mycena citricolor]|uniref:DUF6699 domain-containing protein n=1 Tax=Mycena citricolor TaxID=2018698 RepID=A0AAD2HTT9_9AGAR|nr:unnamed protein product [Mycena citricolor]